jgi:hypothetical protein
MSRKAEQTLPASSAQRTVSCGDAALPQQEKNAWIVCHHHVRSVTSLLRIHRDGRLLSPIKPCKNGYGYETTQR